jgi:AraC-like DNA-binding protein
MNVPTTTHFFSLLNIDHVNLNSTWNYKNIVSPYYRIYYIDDGEGIVSSADGECKLEPGYIYIIPSFTFCNLYCPAYLSQYFVQFFEESTNGISLFHNKRHIAKVKAKEADINLFKRMLAINPGRGINISDNPKVYEKQHLYKAYQELNNRQSLATKFETQGIILQLLALFLESTGEDHAGSGQIPLKVLDVMSYIQLNLDKTLVVHDLAERARQHPDYFSRQFLHYTGVRPCNYIHQQRIERAQYLITTSEMTFDEIAIRTGFESVPYFSKIFKKVTNMTPGQYRKQHVSFGNFH